MTNLEYRRLHHTCPCCGFVGIDCLPYENASGIGLIRGLQPPYEIHFGMPSYEVCPCCSFEYGNDDNPGTATGVSFEAHLRDWISSGTPWFDPKKRPNNWSLQDQLYNAAFECR